MKIFIVSVIIFAVVLIAIFVSLLTITVHYVHENQKDKLIVRITAFFGLFSKTFTILPASESQKGTKVKQQVEEKVNRTGFFKKIRTDLQVVKDLMHVLNNSKHDLRRFFKKTVVHEFVWTSSIGTMDASLTGKLIGAAWSIKGIVQTLVFQFLSVSCRPIFNVTPYFNTTITYTEFRCIISIRVGDAILTAIQILRHWKSGKAKLPSSSLFENNKTV